MEPLRWRCCTSMRAGANDSVERMAAVAAAMQNHKRIAAAIAHFFR